MSSCEECKFLIYDEGLDEYICRKQRAIIYDSADYIDCEFFEEREG